jgi:hypothetical protein
MELANENTSYISTEQSGIAYKVINGKTYWLSVQGVNSLLYPDYKFHIECQTKPITIFWSLRDSWFFSLTDNDNEKQSWKMGLEKLWNTLPDYWKNDSTDPKKATKQCLSIPYFLE